MSEYLYSYSSIQLRNGVVWVWFTSTVYLVLSHERVLRTASVYRELYMVLLVMLLIMKHFHACNYVV